LIGSAFRPTSIVMSSSVQDMLSRRNFLASSVLALPCYLRAGPRRFGKLAAAFAQIEQTNGGRVGVAVLDTATGERSYYRADERFPMCSTFKFLLVSAVLQRVDGHLETLDRTISIPPKPLIFNSPLTEPNAGATMTIAALCHAALTRSDNTAANLLLQIIGGPAGITNFSRSLGDTVTRLDRWELSLNESLADDLRDTTSPRAMAGDLKSVLLGNVLLRSSRDQLTLWMAANVTGLERLRSKLPAGWRAADKTGANGEHTSNDIAIFWPGGRPPIIVTAYITQCTGPEGKRATMLAEIGELVTEPFR
jgi:beta-lactamase class A